MEIKKIREWNERFSIPGIARVAGGNGGLPKVVIETDKATAEIYIYGAQVTSWAPMGRDDVLFVSEKSDWVAGRAIRGGIPVCFPWFRAKVDDPHAPSHGFVRIREWELESIERKSDDAVCVCLSTTSDVETRKLWPYEFRLDYQITIGSSLKLELRMRNCGQSTLRFEEALHTYFNVSDVKQAKIRGLDGLMYLDNREGNREKKQSGDLEISGQTDRAYKYATCAVEIIDPILRRKMRTAKEGSGSTIVWNPWSDGAASMRDLGDEEWREMLCVEGGNILSSAVTLAPERDHILTIAISVDE